MFLLAEGFWMLPMWCKQGSIETIGQKRVKEEWLGEYYPECNAD